MATAQRQDVGYGLDNPLQVLATLPHVARRAPSTRDKAQIGQVWINKLTNTTYMCTSIVANVTQWTNLVGGGTGIFDAVEATLGDITADLGNFVATAGNVIVDVGNITATIGDVNAGGAITAGTVITATTGNIAAILGDFVAAAGTVQIASLSNCMLTADATGHIVTPGAATNGQVLIGSTGAAPVLSTLTAGAGVTITNAAGSITVAAPVTSITWSVINVDGGMTAGNGYICNKVGLLTLTLPAVAAVGDTVTVTGKNTPVGWRVAQNAGQTIHLGAAASTTGIAGYIESTQLYDTAELVCITANTDWLVSYSMGSITVA